MDRSREHRDGAGRPRILMVSAGNINDISMARALLRRAGSITGLIVDRGYDANSLRRLLAERGAEAIIPSTRSRKSAIPYDIAAYRQRNLIDRMFGRLKDFRRIATRYDKLARNFLAGVVLVAAIVWWLN